jgi:ABC-2 type transport system permease protein
MSAFLALTRKMLHESRWMLGITSTTLFGLSWLSVLITHLQEERFRKMLADNGGGGRGAMFRAIGGSGAEVASVAFEMFWWNHPFILLAVLIWPIARGSLAVAGEIERGTLDLALSRPVSRLAYLGAQMLSAVFGITMLAGALVAGNLIAGRFHSVQIPPSFINLLRPALNLAALGLAVYGYTLFFSAIDSVRWRPNLFGSVLTLGGFILLVIANVPVLENWKWLEKASVFKAYDPVGAAVDGKNVLFNSCVLLSIGVVTAILGAFAFWRRDLPANA